MKDDVMSEWLAKAKEAEKNPAPSKPRREPKRVQLSKGNVIMEVAEKLRPWIAKMFEGQHDANGMLVQPAHIRGIALNVAQQIVEKNKYKSE